MNLIMMRRDLMFCLFDEINTTSTYFDDNRVNYLLLFRVLLYNNNNNYTNSFSVNLKREKKKDWLFSINYIFLMKKIYMKKKKAYNDGFLGSQFEEERREMR